MFSAPIAHRFRNLPRLGAVLFCLQCAAPVTAYAADNDQYNSLSGMGMAGGAMLGGFKLQPEWSLTTEAVDLGDGALLAGESIDTSPGTRSQYSLGSVTLSGTGTLPINQGLSLFGKLGVTHWDRGAHNVVLSGFENAQGLDLTYGAGGQYYFGDSLSLHAEWDRYTANQGDIDLFSAGIRYNFK